MTNHVYRNMISYVYGYRLALEDVLRDIERVNTIDELRRIVQDSYGEANDTLGAIRRVDTGSSNQKNDRVG